MSDPVQGAGSNPSPRPVTGCQPRRPDGSQVCVNREGTENTDQVRPLTQQEIEDLRHTLLDIFPGLSLLRHGALVDEHYPAPDLPPAETEDAPTTPTSGTQTRPGTLQRTSDGQMVWGGSADYRGITLPAGSFIGQDGSTIELDRPVQVGSAWYSGTIRVSEDGEILHGVLASETRSANGDILPAGTEVTYALDGEGNRQLVSVLHQSLALTIRGVTISSGTIIQLDSEGYAGHLENMSGRAINVNGRTLDGGEAWNIDHSGAPTRYQ